MTGASLIINERIQDLYDLRELLFVSPSGEAWRSAVRNQNDSVLVWKSAIDLSKDEERASAFLSRLGNIRDISPAVCRLEFFAVDASGYGFVVLPRLDGLPLDEGSIDDSERERRFTACLNLVSRLHAAGVACGDVCPSSFGVTRAGEVQFIGALGSLASEWKDVPIEQLQFQAPEQEVDRSPQPTHDVYALGVLAYYLISDGKYPFGNPEDFRNNSSIREIIPLRTLGLSSLPGWTQGVIDKCLSWNPAERYQSVPELMQDISDRRARDYSNQTSLSKTDSALMAVGQAEDAVQVRDAGELTKDTSALGGISSFFESLSLRARIIGLFLIASVVVLFLTEHLVKQESGSTSSLRRELSIHRTAAANETIRRAIDVLSEQGVSNEEKERELRRLAGLDDPIAHAILVETCVHAPTRKLQHLAEKALVERVRRLGYQRTASQTGVWLNSLGSRVDQTGYEALLSAVDPGIPLDARTRMLKTGYRSYPDSTLLISAALAFDSKEREAEYQPLVASLVQDAHGFPLSDQRSILALTLASPKLSLVFTDDVLRRRSELSDEDLLWTLPYLAGRNDLHLRTFAKVLFEREDLDPLSRGIVQMLFKPGEIPPEALVSLVRVSTGNYGIPDIHSLGRWYHPNAEKVLYIIISDSRVDEEARQVAFEILSSRGLVTEPGSSLVEWVKNNHWDKRIKLAPAVGALGASDIVDQKLVSEAFKTFDSVTRDADFVEVLLEHGDGKVVELLVRDQADLLGLGVLLRLLKHKDKNVRIVTVKALERFNDVGALKLIIDAYELEKDPDVREVYKETFWVIRRREGGEKQ